MSIAMNSTAYEVTPDKLIYDSKHPIDVKLVTVASGSGQLTRGTILSLTSDGKYVVTGSTLASDVTAEANCIIATGVDTTENTGSDIPVEVYVSGHFNENEVTVASSYTLTATDKENLRDAGIFLSSANTK